MKVKTLLIAIDLSISILRHVPFVHPYLKTVQQVFTQLYLLFGLSHSRYYCLTYITRITAYYD